MDRFFAKVYSGGKYLETIEENDISTLKRRASFICNHGHNSYDEMVVEDTETGNCFMLTRINKKSPNNTIVYGSWR
mgnify:CR=1 FL=1